MQASDVVLYFVATLGVIELARLIAQALLFVSQKLRTDMDQLLKEIDREKLGWQRLWTRTSNGAPRNNPADRALAGMKADKKARIA